MEIISIVSLIISIFSLVILFYFSLYSSIIAHFNMFENAYIQFISKRTFFFKKQNNVWKILILLFNTKLVNEL
jgi:hypothetical protein